ncbi:hypothetical protein F5J12DRAFT_745872, partial [Pisolithus orientalis]|uniref:uncharacterized protein n=1 Tax=Pisolithus orientalis TaxID=936130 RepID=UPI00222463EF
FFHSCWALLQCSSPASRQGLRKFLFVLVFHTCSLRCCRDESSARQDREGAFRSESYHTYYNWFRIVVFRLLLGHIRPTHPHLSLHTLQTQSTRTGRVIGPIPYPAWFIIDSHW